jgi:hypothetical protein
MPRSGLSDNKRQTPSHIVKTQPRDKPWTTSVPVPLSTELNYFEAAEYLGINHWLLRRARALRYISAVVYGHRTVRFSIEELERFKRRHRSASIA